MNLVYETSNTLYHHGVKGMRWGHRKGPQVKTSNTDKKRNDSDDKNRQKNALTDKQEMALKIGAVAVGTAVAAYGAKKLSDAMKNKAYKANFERGQKAVKKYLLDLDSKELPIIQESLNNGHVDLSNMKLKYLDNITKRLYDDAHSYAYRNSKSTIAAAKTLLGKNREFTTAELLNMGIKVAGYK